MSEINNIVKNVAMYYEKLDELLDQENEILMNFNVVDYNQIVNEKIDLLNELAEYEKQRLNTYGEITLFELIDQEVKDLKKQEEYKKIFKTLKQSINDKQETNQLLSDQIKSYSDKVLGAIQDVKVDKNTYGRNKSYSVNNEELNLLNRKI